MNYEQFLFTRNQRRDFTAFVRPTDMTHKQVSLLASAFNYINDVAALTSDQPGLYCFPLGAYVFVLRHRDSGRKHAGREIGVIEGIAVRADDSELLVTLLPDIVAQQAEMLDIAGSVGDIEEIEVRKSALETLIPSPSSSAGGEKTLRWDESDAISMPVAIETPSYDADDPIEFMNEETDEASDDDYLIDVGARLADKQLMLPFNHAGRDALLVALKLTPSKPLHFAFGTNGDVIGRLAEAGIEFDVIGLFGVTEPTFRARAVKHPATTVHVEAPAPTVREPEPVESELPARRQHRSLLERLVGWLFGR